MKSLRTNLTVADFERSESLAVLGRIGLLSLSSFEESAITATFDAVLCETVSLECDCAVEDVDDDAVVDVTVAVADDAGGCGDVSGSEKFCWTEKICMNIRREGHVDDIQIVPRAPNCQQARIHRCAPPKPSNRLHCPLQ